LSDFDFVFSLFGLLLGLALAEVLGGFGIAIQHRRKVRIGWLTPLLGALVTLDLTSFWLIAWSVREQVSAEYASLLGGLIVIGLYYFVAKVTFPDDPDDWPDYDAYYFEHRKWVLGGVVLCNLIALATLVSLGLKPLQAAAGIWSLALFIPALFAAMFVKDKRVNVALLLVMIVQYPVVAVLGSG
jgi:drug/metabolite transporter (DMT)-like permease